MTSTHPAQRFIAAVGMFDGVHLGHAHLLRTLADEGRRMGLRPLALTFSRHPLEIIAPAKAPALLTSSPQRCELIRACGIADVRVLDFSATDFALSAADFVRRLHREQSVDALLMGFNNRIGSDRRNAVDICADIPVLGATPYGGMPVSSSDVRRAIADADFAAASRMLGHSFTVRGTVVAGRRLGRTIGFPTANIATDEPRQLLPPDGVYAVDARFDGTAVRGMANIGTRPTVGGHHRTFEVHLIGFDGDLYGKKLDIDFIVRLRDERHFANLDELAAQLQQDRLSALSICK